MSAPSASLADLFPDGDYRFHLTLRRAEPRDFFAPQDPNGAVLAERAHWIAAEPTRHTAMLPEGASVFAEFAAMAGSWGLVGPASGPNTTPTIATLGAALEPDILFLSADDNGQFRLRGGALCFPTGWALEEKVGHPMDFIHGVVPGLNAALASPIHQFLSRLKPGTAFLRDNWGLAGTAELNLHPARRLAAPAPPAALDRLWLRVEHQALLALPQSGGIVFGIRIALHRLDAVARNRAAAAGLRRALASMPADVAAYKRLDSIRTAVVDLL
jgi:dimethylamine monooxygenase subunit A